MRRDLHDELGPTLASLTLRLDAARNLLKHATDAAVEVAAYRIVLEALTNVARHAQAGTCRICLSHSEILYLEIVDDGLGLPQDYREGVGMTSMRERAEELGGSCVIEAAIPSGTCVCARLPFLKEGCVEMTITELGFGHLNLINNHSFG